jgi:PST family polysaccharide transporter
VNFIKNLASLAGGEAASKLLTFAAYAYVARVAGPDGFGFVEFAGAVLLCAGLIVDQGFSPYGAREIARAPERTRALVAQIVGTRCLLAVGAYAAVIGLAVLLDRPAIVTQLLVIYGASLLFMPFLLQWVFQGHDQMQTVAVAQVIRQTVFAAVVFACVRDAAHVWFVAVAEVAGAGSAAAYCLWMYRRRFGAGIRARLVISKPLLRDGATIGLSQMFWTVRMFGATLIVGLVASPQDLGFFAAALRILIALHAFVWLYFFNLMPSLSRAWQRGDGTFAAVVNRSFHAVAWIGAAGGLGWITIAPALMMTVYGTAFAPAGTALQWLAGVCVVAALSGHYRFGLIAARHQTVEMLCSALGAVMAAVLIPVGYWKAGPSGAAAALFTTEVAVWCSAWWCGRQWLGLRDHARLLIRPMLVAVLVSGLLWSLALPSTSGQAAVAVTSFAVLALVCDGMLRTALHQAAFLVRRQLVARLGVGLPETRQQ